MLNPLEELIVRETMEGTPGLLRLLLLLLLRLWLHQRNPEVATE